MALAGIQGARQMLPRVPRISILGAHFWAPKPRLSSPRNMGVRGRGSCLGGFSNSTSSGSASNSHQFSPTSIPTSEKKERKLIDEDVRLFLEISDSSDQGHSLTQNVEAVAVAQGAGQRAVREAGSHGCAGADARGLQGYRERRCEAECRVQALGCPLCTFRSPPHPPISGPSLTVQQTAATFTLNSPESLAVLQDVASTTSPSPLSPVQTAELIREVGLKCISFNGIPRSINCLNAFHDSLPADITSRLETKPTRAPSQEKLPEMTARGRGLWDSVYRPFEDKLLTKLGTSHPDLPVHILNSHYAPLLSDPSERGGLAKTGRVLTSLVALACLRAQTGVGPQVLSHVFGLRKAIEDGSYKAEGQEVVEGAEWLAGDEGSEWLLRTVDSIAEALGGGNFARDPQAKL